MSARMAAGAPDATLRVAVIGTPRTGNTWLRGLLANCLGLEEWTVHEPSEIDWQDLPARCVLQIHWWPVEPFVSRLRASGFRVVSPARHPFDVLLSTLNYAYYTHDPRLCGNEDCGVCSILGAAPRSPEFLRFARGPESRDALAITGLWWRRPDVLRIRYEDLVGDTEGEVLRLCHGLGVEPIRAPSEVAALYKIDVIRPRRDVFQYHYWLGRPGLWRSIFTAEEARSLAEAHRTVFDELGFACDPDESLDARQADANWFSLQLDATRDHLRNEQAKHRASRDELAAVRDQLERVHRLLYDERCARERLEAAQNSLRRDPGDAEDAGRPRRRRPRLGGLIAAMTRPLRSSPSSPRGALRPSPSPLGEGGRAAAG